MPHGTESSAEATTRSTRRSRILCAFSSINGLDAATLEGNGRVFLGIQSAG
jgi:hypothetical protein